MSTEASTGTIPELTIAERLHLARFMSGMEMQELSARTGISRGTVANYESRGWERKRNPAFIRLWAEACGVDLQWIYTGNGGPDGPRGSDLHRRELARIAPRYSPRPMSLVAA